MQGLPPLVPQQPQVVEQEPQPADDRDRRDDVEHDRPDESRAQPGLGPVGRRHYPRADQPLADRSAPEAGQQPVVQHRYAEAGDACDEVGTRTLAGRVPERGRDPDKAGEDGDDDPVNDPADEATPRLGEARIAAGHDAWAGTRSPRVGRAAGLRRLPVRLLARLPVALLARLALLAVA